MSVRLICKQCGKAFALTDSEIRFYSSKGLNQPKRCESCRRKNKKQKEIADTGTVKIYHLNDDRPKYIIISIILLILITGAFCLLKYQKAQSQEEISEQIVTFQENITMETTESLTEEVTETAEDVLPESEAEDDNALEQTEVTTEQPEITYYLNTYRMKFHKPDCPSVKQMNVKSRYAFYGTRQEAVEMGYSPCGNCNP